MIVFYMRNNFLKYETFVLEFVSIRSYPDSSFRFIFDAAITSVTSFHALIAINYNFLYK